jgi:carbon monoxide dehydrogenase subunit G
MKLEGEHIFDGPRETVWELVRDPDVLMTAIPGSSKFNKLSETEYEGEINLRIGPVSGSFSGKLLISKEVPPESCTLKVDGKGAAGFAQGSGNVVLTEIEKGKTLMKYDGDIQVGGKLAGVGQRMLDSVSKSMINTGFDALDKALAARLAAKAGGKEIEYKAPTEAQFATSLAKDMMKNGILSTAEGRMVLYVVPVAAVLVVVAYLLSRCTGG